MPNEGIEVLLAPLANHIVQQKAAGNKPDGILMSTATLKELRDRTDGNSLDAIGLPITVNDGIPFGRIGLSIEVPDGNLTKTLEDLKNGL